MMCDRRKPSVTRAVPSCKHNKIADSNRYCCVRRVVLIAFARLPLTMTRVLNYNERYV
jgi:hypothetical protein